MVVGDIGLGSAAKVSLANARKRAEEVRGWMEMGLDPIFEKRKAHGIPTFKEAAAKAYAANQKTCRTDKHEWQWKRTLEQFVYPTLGNVSVAEITGPTVRNVLAEIWLSKPETVRRVRQRIGCCWIGLTPAAIGKAKRRCVQSPRAYPGSRAPTAIMPPCRMRV
jgi:hypothetical protein